MEYGTRSRGEHGLVWIIIAAVLGVLILFVAYSFWPSNLSSTTVTVGAKTFYADVAATEELRAAGLTERRSLADDQAFLMVYDSDEVWPVETRKIDFPVDVAWIDDDKRVVFIAKNARATGTGTGIFKPKGVSRYVLLLPAGSIDKYAIKPGKAVKFEVK